MGGSEKKREQDRRYERTGRVSKKISEMCGERERAEKLVKCAEKEKEQKNW